MLSKYQIKQSVKNELKILTAEIRALKSKRKSSPNGYVEGLFDRKREFRFLHIFYCCELNNTPYDKVEKPDKYNTLDVYYNEYMYKKIKERYVKKVTGLTMEEYENEDVRASAA